VSLAHTHCERMSREYRFPMRLSLPEKRVVIYYLNKHGDLSFFPNISDLPFILFLFKELEKKTHVQKKVITRNTLLTETNSRPREHAHNKGFKSIPSDDSSICHKTSSKLLLLIDSLHLVHCFKICFNYVLPLPTESSVN